jgi:hypothetical protein
MRFDKSKRSLVWHVGHTPNTTLPDDVDLYTLSVTPTPDSLLFVYVTSGMCNIRLNGHFRCHASLYCEV